MGMPGPLGQTVSVRQGWKYQIHGDYFRRIFGRKAG